MRKIAYMFAASLLVMGGAQATIVYQDTFNSDGLATNIGVGGGAVNKTINLHSWADDGNATLIHNGTVHSARALLYSSNSFQNDDGLRLTVNYSISNTGATAENEFSFGLISADTNLSTYTGYNPFSQTASVYSLGLELTTDTASRQGLVFSSGSTITRLDAYSFAAGTGTAVIEIAAGGAWSYSINGVEQGSGTIAGFDLSKSYHFAAYGRDDVSTRSIHSVTIESITNSVVTEWTGSSDSNWNVDANWSTGLTPGSTTTDTVLLSGTNDDVTIATPIEATSSFSLILQDEAQLNIRQGMHRFIDLSLGSTAGVGGGRVVQSAAVTVADDLRIGDHASASSDSSYTVTASSLNVIDELYVDQGVLSVSSATASLATDRMTLTDKSRLKFIFNAYGTGSIVVSNALTIADGATLEIDMSGYTMGGNEIELIQFGSLNGAFDPADVTIVGLGGGTLTYGSNSLTLSISDGVQEPSGNFWFKATGSELEVNTGRMIRDLSSASLIYNQATDGNDYLYTITWGGSDFDGDGANDTISFDLRVAGFSGSSYTYSASEAFSSATLGNSANVTLGSGWGIGGDVDLDAGESLRFSVENVSVSASGYTATVDGFLSMSFEELGGHSHKIIFGEGAGLNSFIDSTPDFDYALAAATSATVTSAGNSNGNGLYVSSVGFKVSVTDPSNPLPEWDANDYSIYPVGPQMVDDYEAETDFSNYPEFSWDRVPRWATINGALTSDQAQTLAPNIDVMSMGGFESETKTIADSSLLKQYNPNIKTLFYLNSAINFNVYNADAFYNTADWNKYSLDANGDRVYDMIRIYYHYNHSHPDMHDWWLDLATYMSAQPEVDGVFIDKNGGAARADLRAMSPSALLIGNSLRNAREGGARSAMAEMSGSYVELWEEPYDDSPIAQTVADARSVSIQLMREAALKGKILMPALQDRLGDTALDLEEAELLATIRRRVTLPLAYYLIIAEQYSYFRYQPDQNTEKHPEYVWDPTNYVDELTRPLGAPLGPPVKNGYIYTRSFEHLDVWLDVEASEAKLEWHPKAHWSLNEGTGTVANDSSGNNYDGTITNGTWVTGVEGNALDFNGSTTKVTLPAAAFSEVSDKVSIAMWVYGDTTQPRNDSVFYATDASGNKALNIHLPWSNSTVFWDAGNSGAAYDRISKAATASDFMGQWNHWVFTKSATTGEMKIYLNGSLWHSEAGKVQVMSGITAASIGGSALVYDGMIDDVRLYNVALNDVEVAALYAETVPVASALTATLQEDGSTSITLAGSDPNGDSLTYAIVSSPAHGSLSGTMPNLIYTPNADFYGTDSFTYRVNDGAVDSATATVSITVTNINDAPVFTADPIAGADAMQNTAYTGSLLALDADGDSLSYTKVSGPAWLTVATDGSLSGTPLIDDIGANSWTVAVSDGNGAADQAVLNIAVQVDPNPAVRITEYYLTTGDFSSTTAMLTLDQDLADDYYILIRGSRTGDGGSYPNNDYARIVSVPGGKGDLADSGTTDEIGLQRQAADFDWEGVVTVVECSNSASGAGFKLIDILSTAMSTTSGTDTSVAWSDLSQVVLFGGYRGGGVEMFGAPTSGKQGTGCYTRLYPSGTNTLNWSRNAGGETLFAATMTTFVVEWGSEWTVQHVNVVGNKGSNGADAVGEYTTAAINTVTRANTWIWATGTRADSGIGDSAESCLVTLGDGVNQNVSESSVAVGSEYSDTYNFDVYALTHAAIQVEHYFKIDGDATGLDVAVPVNTAAVGARFGWVYNGCNGVGATFPRPRFWSRYTSDSEITISRGYDGQKFPAWVQGIDLSGLNR